MDLNETDNYLTWPLTGVSTGATYTTAEAPTWAPSVLGCSLPGMARGQIPPVKTVCPAKTYS